MKVIILSIIAIALTQCRTPENSQILGWRTGNNVGDHPNAWFSDESKVVSVCLNIDKNVQVSKEELEINFREAFLTWHNYLAERGYVVTHGNPYFKGFAYKLEFSCQNADLSVLFGVELEKGSHLLTRFPSNSSGKIAGIALYHDQKDPNYRVGTIWIAPQNSPIKTPKNHQMVLNWDQDLLRKTVITHEVGHVFGVPHIPQTIMAENILDSIFSALKTQKTGFDKLADNERFAPEMIAQIDHTFEILSPNLGSKKNYVGYLGEKQGLDENSYLAQVLNIKTSSIPKVNNQYSVSSILSRTTKSRKDVDFELTASVEGSEKLICKSEVHNAQNVESILGKSFLIENPLDPETYLGFDSISGQYRMKCESGILKGLFVQARYNTGNVSIFSAELETPAGSFEPLFSSQSPRFFHKN